MVKPPFPWQDSTRFPGLRKSHARALAGGVSAMSAAKVVKQVFEERKP
jgi:hypothetical protein